MRETDIASDSAPPEAATLAAAAPRLHSRAFRIVTRLHRNTEPSAGGRLQQLKCSSSAASVSTLTMASNDRTLCSKTATGTEDLGGGGLISGGSAVILLCFMMIIRVCQRREPLQDIEHPSSAQVIMWLSATAESMAGPLLTAGMSSCSTGDDPA